MKTVMPAVIAFWALLGNSGSAVAASQMSRVYVTAYHCATEAGDGIVKDAGKAEVHLYNLALTGPARNKAATPDVEGVKPVTGGVQFYFDVPPGNYDAYIDFPSEFACNANGPLLVLPGTDRHLYTSGVHAVTDWHGTLGIAGHVGVQGVTVHAAFIVRPAKCGDDSRYFDRKYEDGTMDDGVYYANLPSDNRLAHNVVLILSGALFTERIVLVTEPMGGPGHRGDVVVKDVTPEVLAAAAASPNKFACVPGF